MKQSQYNIYNNMMTNVTTKKVSKTKISNKYIKWRIYPIFNQLFVLSKILAKYNIYD
mgnify:FL=1